MVNSLQLQLACGFRLAISASICSSRFSRFWGFLPFSESFRSALKVQDARQDHRRLSDGDC